MHSRSTPSKAVQDALSRLPDSAWTPFEKTADYVRSYTILDIGGVLTRAERTEYLADQLLQDANRQEYAESEGKRWKDGRVVARVPLNKFFAELAPYVRMGDREHVDWWLERQENLPFRTFRGRMK